MKSSIISEEDGMILKEHTITLSNEKMRGILLQTYEKAVVDVFNKKLQAIYRILFSISFTLFLSIITTSKYAAWGPSFDEDSVKCLLEFLDAWFFIFACLFWGASLFLEDNEKDKRDKSINEILDKNCNQ